MKCIFRVYERIKVVGDMVTIHSVPLNDVLYREVDFGDHSEAYMGTGTIDH